MSTTMKPFDIRDELELDIHSMRPSGWMRYGILSAFLILLVLLGLGHVIQYPDTVYGEFRLLSSQPSITIPLPQGAQIDRIFKKNGATVAQGDDILLFKNSTDYRDVNTVAKLLAARLTTEEQVTTFFEQVKDQTFSLGELQELWTQLYGKLLEHYTIVKLQRYDTEIRRLNRQLNKQYQLNKSLKGLLSMNGREEKNLDEYFSIDSVLYSESVISKADYLVKEQEHISKSKGQQQHVIATKRNELEIISLVNTIEAAKEEKNEKLLAVHFQITETVSALTAAIDTWKEKYLVEAPIPGTLNYLGTVDEKKFVVPEEHRIVITPGGQAFKAVIQIPLLRAGKVVPGQAVHFKLTDYPHREYGYLEGTLTSVANVAGAEYYLGQVTLGEVLTTNYHKAIHVKENMHGTAEIITDDRSILARVLDKFLYIFRK